MTHLYRLALRLLLPGVYRGHHRESVETAASLAREARAHGVAPWARYWIDEFASLIRAGWHEHRQRKAPSMGSLLSGLLRDVRFSVRLLWRTPGVTAIALVTLALGIGANTAIFSIINGVLLKPLPYRDADRLYLIQHVLLTDPTQQGTTSPGNYFDIAAAVRGFRPIAAFSGSTETMTGHGEPERLQGIRSAGSVLEVAGVTPVIGRIITAGDEQPAAPRVIVISHALWQRTFGGKADVLGQTVNLAGVPQTIVGVMPKGFTFPDTRVDYWGPAQFDERLRTSRTEYFLTIVGRLADGATPGAARGELDAVMARLRASFPEANSALGLDAQRLDESLVANVSRLLWILMGCVGCVLLIACANLANLLLARATGRGREIAIRQAIGAGRGRVVRQLLAESLVLAMLGGALGVLVGAGFLSALIAWLPAGIPRLEEATVDTRVLLVTFAVAALTGIFFGLAPALQLARSAPAVVLRDDARTSTGRSTLRSMLVVGELAMTLVLLAGAGLLIRSFMLMQRVDPGFKTDGVLTFTVRMEGPAYAASPARLAYVNGIVERLRTLPGVIDAAASSNVPIAGRGTGAWFNVIARPVPRGTTPPAIPYRVITPGYFRTMQIPIVRGRFLEDRDGTATTPGVVISESVAKRFWASPADGDAIGSEIYLGAPDNKLFERATVVGIARNVPVAGLGGTLTDSVYVLNTLMPYWRSFVYTVRTSGNPTALAGDARAVVRQMDPALAITGMQSMTDIMRTSVAPTRASMLLLVLFAAIAMIMAAVGVFGVMSYSVTLRAREMGIRLALGASPREVRGMIIRGGLKQAGLGVAIGIGGALWLTRLMESMLFGVTPTDPMTLVSVATILLAFALAACYLPARRATRVDPLIVLRTE